MKPIIYIIAFISLYLSVNGQSIERIHFVEYDVVINELENFNKDLEFSSKWDYEAILLLDTAHIELIKDFDPYVVSNFRESFLFTK